ncbi:ferritin-like domain-containing protein [Phenylobacterium immobile]|uniref:ferritin-like domain-containing protein n=1 Tax=Phenylobacterium immobile TaxID=21 RepID=UPI000AD160F8|nr:ferritin-like domain-containing protein [Phenylobacterium immobile]
MIDTREQLIHVLTEAAEVEHNLLCSYLYAVFSLKRAGEEGLSEAQGEAVERWRKLILSVALEEMTHLACVNNLLLAVGGATHFDRPNLPVAPGYHPAGVVVRLTPFDAETLEHFIFLERPVSARVSDAPGFASADAGREVPGRPLTPSAIDYATIGELYDALAEGFTRLSAELGEHALIDPGGLGVVSKKVVHPCPG